MGRRAVGNDNETDYHREVYWHRCCSTVTPTTSPYTPTLAASYADDLCIASQGNDFSNIVASFTSALSAMTTYYDTNHLRANSSKTQVCAFHGQIPPTEPRNQTRTECSGTVPDSQTQQHQCIWPSTFTELCAIKRTSREQI